MKDTSENNLNMKNNALLITGICLLFLISCKNRDINEGEVFKPREIHENIVFHFDMIEVDGIEYLILEKDNNNPHEGFGFMAFRANKLMEKQDTVIAYLKTISEIQTRIYSSLTKKSEEAGIAEVNQLLKKYLKQESELQELEQTQFQSESIVLPELED